MPTRELSLILLSTLQCNASCEYCFEHRTADRLTIERLGVLIGKVLDFLQNQSIGSLTIYWQGGEAMLLSPDWYDRAYDLISEAATERGVAIRHCLQSNLLAYTKDWNPVVARMFGNSIGTSFDYPNLHRKLPGRSPAHYDQLWLRKLREAQAAGIRIDVISLPNRATLEIGAEPFYEHLVDELALTDLQINTPFPGGESNPGRQERSTMSQAELLRFHLDLAVIWLERGLGRGVRIAPFDALLDHFSHRHSVLPCFWGDNCVDRLIAVDARGHVAQCDCWVTSYPEYRFGNIFSSATLAELLRGSEARRKFIERPMVLAQRKCIDCDYLSLCHGGCPIRTHAHHGTLFETDPYCELYQELFRLFEQAAVRQARQVVRRQSGSTDEAITA
ncbi:radical SAM protein [Accumulibacter sp.]|uniref:radical SAM protein n=1 Tax=Accumulibacter sp. TaxID=2053492 RepID=UPI0025F920A9|nr:radical SAM protein [Accumulibacter sp.]MCM8663126.1 radical SAM protein [Accumulibacter sp.]